jgi:hypothetical protein
MFGRSSYLRLLAAIGAVAVLAVGSTAPGLAKTHPTLDRAAEARLVSLGYGPCGELEVFVIVKNGHRSQPMC